MYVQNISGYYYLIRKVNGKKKILRSLGKVSQETAEEELEKLKNLFVMPLGEFDVIYVDPPWRYDFAPSNTTAIESHYHTMELEDICALRVPAAEDAILYLWGTQPKLKEALVVMDAWGFNYKSGMVWVKDRTGMGYHVLGRHELLLIGTRGAWTPPATNTRWESVIFASRGEHSRKPEIVYDIIEGAYPADKYRLLELFARNKRSGWTCWGDEIGN